MKRKHLLIATVLLLLTLSLLFGACGKKQPGTTPEATTPEETRDLFKITFVVGDTSTVVETKRGEVPVFSGSTIRPSDETNTYRFLGWDSELTPADGDKTYTALYETVPLVVYTVKWDFAGGLHETKVKEGDVPTPPSAFSDSYLTKDLVYTFTGWNKELVALTKEYVDANKTGEFILIRANYKTSPRTYTVSFSMNGEIVAEVKTAYNEYAVFPSGVDVSPKTGFNFIKWSGIEKPIKEDTILTGSSVMLDPAQLSYALTYNTISFSKGEHENKGSVFAEASSLLYLLLEVRQSPDPTGESLVYLNRIMQHLHTFVGTEGITPYFDLEPYWCYVPLTAAITLAKNTPLVWNQLDASEIEKYDFIMECFAYILTFGTDDDNKYLTGPGLAGNYSKTWNPNYRLANVLPMVFVGQYFGGAAAVNEKLLSFSYDATMAKFEQYGFTRALERWADKQAILETDADGNPTLLGPTVKELLENGGNAYLKERNDSTGDRLDIYEGRPAGSGVGVRTTYTYLGHDLDDVSGILRELLVYNYSGGKVVSHCCLAENYPNVDMKDYKLYDGKYLAYILDGKRSPYEGMYGMMLELGKDNRSSCSYASHDFNMITASLATLLELDKFDLEDSDNRDLLNLAWVGNADLMFKYANGYQSFASNSGISTSRESTSNGYLIWKSYWNMLYGHYTPETLPDFVVPFEPVLKEEDFEESEVLATGSTGKVTVNNILYGADGKNGITISTVQNADGTNTYLLLTQDPSGKDPAINLSQQGGLVAALGEDHTSIVFTVSLAKQPGVSLTASRFRMRFGSTSDVINVFCTTSGGEVYLGNTDAGHRVITLTEEFVTLSFHVDFTTGTMSAACNGEIYAKCNIPLPASAGTLSPLEWIRSKSDNYIFNWYFSGNKSTENGTAIRIDDLSVRIEKPTWADGEVVGPPPAPIEPVAIPKEDFESFALNATEAETVKHNSIHYGTSGKSGVTMKTETSSDETNRYLNVTQEAGADDAMINMLIENGINAARGDRTGLLFTLSFAKAPDVPLSSANFRLRLGGTGDSIILFRTVSSGNLYIGNEANSVLVTTLTESFVTVSFYIDLASETIFAAIDGEVVAETKASLPSSVTDMTMLEWVSSKKTDYVFNWYFSGNTKGTTARTILVDNIEVSANAPAWRGELPAETTSQNP